MVKRMKKVLFISYYWPPSGKNTLHWPLFVMRHLPEFGWQPGVLTVEKDSFSFSDESLCAYIAPDVKVLRTKVHDPFSLYKKFIGKKQSDPLIGSEMFSHTDTSWRHRLAVWMRLNIFIPDARIGWYCPALRGGESFIDEEKPEAIVTIGPPHSSHLIGRKLSRRFGLPHVAVFIDPWVDIAYYRGYQRTKWALALDTHWERSVMESARRLVFVTHDMCSVYMQKYPCISEKSDILYWGYSGELFPKNKPAGKTKEEVLLHAGNLYDYQNPQSLWKNIRYEIDRGRPLRLRFVGTVSSGIRQTAGLGPYTAYLGFLPLPQVLEEMEAATYLLFCATEKRHVPGKLFEYLRAGNRIIGFGDDNEEIQMILQKAHAGKLFPYQYQGTDIFQQVQSMTPDPDAAAQFDRKIIAQGLAKILDEIT